MTVLEDMSQNYKTRQKSGVVPLFQLSSSKAQRNILTNQVERSLLASSLVTDCKVQFRETSDVQQEMVVYVVPADSFSLEKIADLLSRFQLPNFVVPLTNMPLTSTGEVDEQKLSGLELLDAKLVQKWEKLLAAQPEIQQSAVVIQEHVSHDSTIHLSELLDDWHDDSKSPKIPEDRESQSVSSVSKDSIANVPAVAQGGTLDLAPDSPKNLTETLLRTAKHFAHKGLVFIQPDNTEIYQSYPDLLTTASKVLAGLRNIGLQPQDKVILQLPQNQDFIVAFWACILGGFIPVPLATSPTYEPENNGAKKLANAWQVLHQPLIITTVELAPAIQNFATKLSLKDLKSATLDSLALASPIADYFSPQPDDVALFLLTSGSTGKPKTVQLSHHNILSSIAATSQAAGFGAEDISLNWLPLDHPGPLIRCVIRMVYLGCQQLHASTDIVLAQPLKWLDWLDKYRVTSTWSPNFAIALLNDCGTEIKQGNWDLTCVKSFLSTAEPIVPQTSRNLLELLQPHGLKARAMHSSWGMAETSSGVTHSAQYLSAANFVTEEKSSFAELGLPVPGITLRIVDAQGNLVMEQVTGYLEVKGNTVTSGYVQNTEANAKSFSADGWFKTGDLGFLDQGRLTITGRTKDVIIINGKNCYSHEIEGVVEGVPGVEVSYTAACGIRQPGSNTDHLLIFFHTKTEENEALLELLKTIQQAVVRKIGASPAYLIPVSTEAVPKTSIGKIQRSQLKQRFEAGEFAAVVKKIDILLANENTLPDWFYTSTWICKEAINLDPDVKTGINLIFLDSLGLGQKLSAALRQGEQPVVTVAAGSDYCQLSSASYTIDPQNPSHYQQLLQSLGQPGQSIAQILHLWNYEPYGGEISSLAKLEEAQQKGVYSLLYLVKALDKHRSSQQASAIRLQVIGSHSQLVGETESLAYERSPILGLIRTIPQELPWLDCRHLDLPQGDVEQNLDYVIRELQVIQPEQEVAYRNGQRLIVQLTKVDPTQNIQPLPFQTGGMYLISGGLGGIAVEIAKHLLSKYQARLLLIGRTPLPERDDWSSYLAQSAQPSKLSERIKTYLSLEQLGGEVAYEAVDICDLSQLQQIVAQHSNTWQQELDGVIHLAGSIQTSLLREEKLASFSATLRPKVLGTWTLHQLIKNRPDAVFINFSSVNGFFGRMTAGSYSAANRFLDAFSQHQRQSGFLRSFCLAWSMWEETGLSRNYEMKQLTRARGYQMITPEQGLNSFLVGLQQNHPYLLVGLDQSKKFVQQYVAQSARPTQCLTAYFTAATKALATNDFADLQIRDRFGNPSSCQFKQLPEMPLTESGAIDREQLVQGKKTGEREHIAPRNEVEKQLAVIWQQVLNITTVDIQDNFFELGGDSIKAVRLFGEIEKSFQQNLPLATLFQAPTIEALGKILAQQPDSRALSCLVPIRREGSKPPLFLIHARGISILFYRDLAKYVAPGQPLYGIQPQGLCEQEEILDRVEEMAAYYIKEIKAVQPVGPYFLGGYSFGGNLAFEMAQQLYQQGEQVEKLILFDCRGKNCYERQSMPQRLLIHLNNLSQEKHHYLISKAKKWQRWLQEDFQYNFQKAGAKLFTQFGLPLPLQLRNIKVEERNRQAEQNYQPQPYPGKANLLRAEEWLGGVGYEVDRYLGWGSLVDQGIEIYDVPGNHFTILEEPNIQKLGQALNKCLEE